RKAKAINNLTLMDDKFFRFFFKDNPEALEDVISACLGEEGLKVERMNTQDDIVNLYGHSIIFDAKVITKDGRHIDVEVQNGHFDERLKCRMQYYRSALEFNSLERNVDYENMKDTYVIFILDNDPLEMGAEKYSTEDVVVFQPYNQSIKAKSHIVLINGKTNSDSAIGKLVKDFRCKDSENMQYNSLRERMKNIRKPEVIETMQSELDKIYEEEYEERLEKRFAMGREEGIATGREEEKSAIVQKMKNVGIPIDLISRCTGLSSGEIQAI
ncbi:MAG: Rpn family recombination-promoting nuclease/putative transposase, partial [Spirochaetales bacterium]|nr:Rpn family recombination-promoting nuclease/putative transposase [Spirochaetales bacterium]